MRLYIKYGLPWWYKGDESACQYRRPGFNSWVEKILWKWQPSPVFLPGKSHGQKPVVHGVTKESNMTWQLNNNLLTERKTHNIRAPSFIQAPYCGLGFPSSSDSKKSTCNVGNLDLIPGLGRSPGEGNGYPLQYSVSQPVESVVSDSLRPHGLQHAMPPYLSPTPRASSNSSPSSRWCHPTSSSSVIPFSSCLQSFPASRSFPMSQFFASGGQMLEFQLQHQSFPWIFRTDFL